MAAKTSKDGRDDSADGPLAADCADLDRAGEDVAQVSVPGTAGNIRGSPADSAAAPQVAGVAAAFRRLSPSGSGTRRNARSSGARPAPGRTGGPRRT